MLGTVIQIDGWDPVAGAAVTLRAASHDEPAVCHLDGATWWPAIAKLPTLRYDLFDGDFGGQITAPASSMTLRTEPWPEFGRYSLADARFRLWTGEVGAPWSEWTLRFDGRLTARPSIRDGAAELAFAVDDRWLDTPLLATYAGTGGIEGPEALKGTVKPLALGAPRYVPGVLVDAIATIFQLSAYGAIVAVDEALEKLAGFGLPVADHPSFAALEAAEIPRGRFATCRAGGLVRFGAPTEGTTCFQVRGDMAGPDGWARRPGRLIRRIAQLAGGLGRLSDSSLAALDAARPYNLSIYLDQQTTARDLIQRLAASINAVAGVSWLGKLFVLPVAIGAASLTLAADGSALPPVASVDELEIAAPWKRLAIGAERAWTVHQLSDVAFTAPLTERGAYDAGTIYREGDIVSLPDGSRWLRQAAAPSAGIDPVEGATWTLLTGKVLPKWEDVADPNGTKPKDGADKTSENVAKDTSSVAGRPADQLLREIDGLITGENEDAASAAASARASATARDASVRASEDSAAARQAARDEALASAQSARNADGYAITASGSARTAKTEADAAGERATTAEGHARTAGTKAGEASTSAGNAASSERNAKGSENRASSFAEVAATTAADANLALAASFPRNIRAGAFTEVPNFDAPALPDNAVAAGRIVRDTSVPSYPYGVWTRGVLPYVVGKRYRLNAKVEWVAGHPDQPAVIFYAHFYRADGSLLFETTIGPATALLGNVATDVSTEILMEGSPEAAFMRPAILVNRKPSNLGLTTIGRTDVLALYPEDITASSSAAVSASAAAADARTAGTKADAAGLSAEAAARSEVNADAANRGSAASAKASSDSAAVAGDKASAASASQRLAAAYTRTRGLTPNARFTEDAEGWGLAGSAYWHPAPWIWGPGIRVSNAYGKVGMIGGISVDPTRKYRLGWKCVVHGDAGTPRATYIGLECFGAQGQHLGNVYAPDARVAGSKDWPPGTVMDAASIFTGTTGAAPYYGHVGAFITGTVSVRPVALLNYPDGDQGGTTDLNALWLEDVTSEQDAAGQAEAARAQAVSASDDAARAGESALLSARLSTASLNRNSTFSDWADGQPLPARWQQWDTWPNAGRTGGLVGRFGVQMNTGPTTGIRNGGMSTFWALDPSLLNVAPQRWWVLEADVTLEAGYFGDAGLHINFYNGNGVALGAGQHLAFHDPEGIGTDLPGLPGRRHQFSKLIQDPHPETQHIYFYAMNSWAGFGGPWRDKIITWHRASLRPASQAEIDLRKPGGIASTIKDTADAVVDNEAAATRRMNAMVSEYNGIGSEVREQAGTLARVDGRTASYWSVSAIAGSSTRSLRLFSDSDGGGGFLIDSNVMIRGDLTLTGTLPLNALVRSQFSCAASYSVGNGSPVQPALGQTVALLDQPLGTIGEGGTFTFVLFGDVRSNAGTRGYGDHAGRPLVIDYIGDGGLSATIERSGAVLAQVGSAIEVPNFAAAGPARMVLRLFNNNYRSEPIYDAEQGTYFQSASATYTFYSATFRARWVFV